MLRNVVAVACDRMAAFELAVICEVFGLDRTGDGLPGYDFAVCAAERPPLRTTSGFSIDTPFGLDRLAEADLIAVPAWRDVNEKPPARLLEALREAHARGARLMSVCTGAFVLAASGLLDGRRATTHWRHVGKLAERYPAICVEPDVLYVDEGQVLTSAGTAAGIDLCLHIVRQEHGAVVANSIARRMVVPPHRAGGQAQYTETIVPDTCSDNGIPEVLAWAQRRLNHRLTVDRLASRAHMSPRTFARRFVQATGTTPHRWLLTQRLMLAQRLLEGSELSVELVAENAGFGTAAALREHFGRHLQTSPLAYRRLFNSLPERSASSGH